MKPTDDEIVNGLLGLVAIVMIVAALISVYYYFNPYQYALALTENA